MGMLLVLFVIGLGGSLVFEHFNLPGGAMTGAMVAVLLFKAIGSISTPPMPDWVKFLTYGCVGVIVGNMYNPGMLQVVRETWHILLLSTALILLAGCLCAWLVARSGALSAGGAYLATSPGGFNAIVALSGGLSSEAPMVMFYHLVRIYSVVLLAPYIAKLLGMLTTK